MMEMSPFGGGFGLFGVFFVLIFVIVISVFIFIIGKSISQGIKNNNSPRLTVAAQVSSKRTEVSGGSGDSSSSTWYYATFEVESGDRMELAVNGREYGQLAEGDIGSLTFQGTRYIEFQRIKAQ